MEQAIAYIEVMRNSLTGKSLRIESKKWMAENLLKRFRSKRPFPMTILPDAVKKCI